jgi:phosphatidylserine decarboxylase
MKWKISQDVFPICIFESIMLLLFLIFALWKGYSFLWIGFSVLLLLTVWTLYFFRDPDRMIPEKENCILSPADGRILHVETAENLSFYTGPAQRVSIFLSLWDVHVNRIPVGGTVSHLQYLPGCFYPAFTESASNKNEQNIIGIESKFGPLFLKQIAGILARRIVCRLEKGNRVEKGDRFGIIKWGSRVELYLPMAVKIHVSKGDRVRGGESIIGEVKRNG